MARGKGAAKKVTSSATRGGRGRGRGRGGVKGRQPPPVVRTKQSDENSDEYVMVVSSTDSSSSDCTPLVPSTDSSGSENCTPPVPSTDISVYQDSSSSECAQLVPFDDTEQFSLGSVLAKTRSTIGNRSIELTSSDKIGNSENEDLLYIGDEITNITTDSLTALLDSSHDDPKAMLDSSHEALRHDETADLEIVGDKIADLTPEILNSPVDGLNTVTNYSREDVAFVDKSSSDSLTDMDLTSQENVANVESTDGSSNVDDIEEFNSETVRPITSESEVTLSIPESISNEVQEVKSISSKADALLPVPKAISCEVDAPLPSVSSEGDVPQSLPLKKRGRPKGGKNRRIESKPSCLEEKSTSVPSSDSKEVTTPTKEDHKVEKKVNAKNWTDAIWGPKTDPNPNPVQVSDVLKAVQQVKPRRKSFLNAVAVSLTSSSNNTPSNSPGGSINTTPRSISPESTGPIGSNMKSAKKLFSGRKKKVVVSDSEDSSVSTDSPLKPKTYNRISRPPDDDEDEDEMSLSRPVTPTNKLARIPRKDRGIEISSTVEECSKSPEEELPLIPKGFLEQKKKLENEEAARREKEDNEKEAELIKQQKEEKEIARKALEIEDKADVEKRLKSFKHLKENHYLCSRKVNKQSKKMQCDCTLSKEEISSGESGCGDDCLNRLLFIECGKGCQLDSLCSNKRFQNLENADIEVFKTDWKGFGIRATTDIPKDSFLMEYVGEVLDPKQFRKRAKQYAREEVQHFYFMALSKELYVDATYKGNISRFINHSCDPNSETQKWTVNGELRVGFFTKRRIQAGEELNFDYKYERYGTVAQKCYCGTGLCRGWLGGEPSSDSGIDEMEEWSSSEEEEIKEEETKEEENKGKEIKDKKKKRRRPAKKIKNFEVDEYEEEMDRLSAGGIKNKIQTVQLCRLMVRATRLQTRLRLAAMLLSADQPCLRLFLDYQGLRILSHWMLELEWTVREELDLKLKIESVLATLSIPHKTMLVDSKVLQTIERWSVGKDGVLVPHVDNQTAVESTVSSRSQSPDQTGSDGSLRPAGDSSSQGDETGGESSQGDQSSSDNVVYGENMGMNINSTEGFTQFSRRQPESPGEEEEPAPPGEEGPSLPVLAKFILEPPPPPPPPPEEMPSCILETVVGVVGEEIGEQVAAVLKAQADVGDNVNDVDSDEKMFDLVEPVAREEIPLSEEEEKLKTDIGGKVMEDEEEEFVSEEGKMINEIMKHAKELLLMWSVLQEVFKIPKKERQKVRREHEMEADRSSINFQPLKVDRNSSNFQPLGRQKLRREHEMLEADRISSNFQPLMSVQLSTQDNSLEGRMAMLQANARLYASIQANQVASSNNAGQETRIVKKSHTKVNYNRGYRGGRGFSVTGVRDRRNLRLDDRTGRLSRSDLYKEDRRMLFQAKVEEENRQKVMRQAVSARHTQCCRLLGLPPDQTPMLPSYPEFYLSGGKWIPMPTPPLPLPTDWTPPVMAALPSEAFRPGDPPLPNPRTIYPPGVCPDRPPSPPPPANMIKCDVSLYEDVCAYYDRLYYTRSPSESRSLSLSPSPSPLGRRHHLSPSDRLDLSPMSGRRSGGSNYSSPGVSPPPVRLHCMDLSPDYRSPSPVQRSSSPTHHLVRRRSPSLSSDSYYRSPDYYQPDPHSPKPKKPRLIPTSIPFLSSCPPDSSDIFSPIRQELVCSLPISDDEEFSPRDMSPYDEKVTGVTQSAGSETGGVTVRLPPRWRVVQDSCGRTYYYHTESRIMQWEVPETNTQGEEDEEGGQTTHHNVETADTDDEDDDGEDTDTESDEEEAKEGEEADPEIPDSDLSASEKRMLMRMRGRTKEERTNIRKMKKERDKVRREAERKVTRERHTRHRRDGLVVEHHVPARISDRDKEDLMTFSEMRERLLNKDKIREQQMKEEKEEDEKDKREEKVRFEKARREEMKEKRAAERVKREAEFKQLGESKISPGAGAILDTSQSDDGVSQSHQQETTQAAADTSSDVDKKNKEKFVKEMSKVVVKILDPYRKKGVRGHIGNNDDFKHLAKKLTYTIMHKELKQCKSTEELKATEKVKKKASEYVTKYMKKYEREYKKSPDQE